MVSGFALGGFSEGFNRAQRRRLESQRIGLQSRALDINEQELRQKKIRQQMDQTSEALGTITQAITELKRRGQEPGTELLTMGRGFASQLDRWAELSGVGGSPGSAMLQAALSAERELTEDEIAASSIPRVQESLSAAGVDVSAKDLAIGAGLINKPDQPKLVSAMVNGEQRFFSQSLDDNGNVILEEVDTEARPVPSGLSFSFDPETGRVELAQGAAVGLTGSEQTSVQENVRQSQELLSNLQNLADSLEEGGRGVVGLPGAIRGLVNVTVAQAVPDAFSSDRSEFERWTKLVRQSALRIVSDESRFSEADRDYIFDLFPSTGPFESVEAGRDKLRIMQAFFARRLLQSAEKADIEGIEVPGLTNAELADMVTRGSLTEGEARRLVKLLTGEDDGR